ncbi:sensor histidine kinase [Flaviaesturariibacter amylovorans]|uniref:histidine kinase n=1 Tax=Flaviaesturariibacter amylovorans TaxID=1084520 RepID=A0ABP8GFV8_9BACT
MNAFFRRLPLLAKLMLIGFIPLCFLIFLTIEVYQEKTEKLRLFRQYHSFIDESADINALIDALQEERKYSFDYAMTRSMRPELERQRPRTDSLIRRLLRCGDPALEGFTGYTRLGQLDSIRNGIDSFSTAPNGVMHFYSNTVFRLNTLNTLPPANTAFLHPVYKDLVAQKILSEMMTYLGIIRSNIYNVLHTGRYATETLAGSAGAYDVYRSYEAEFRAKATPDMLAQYDGLRRSTPFGHTTAYIDSLFKRFAFDSTYTAVAWWKVSDEGVGALRNFQHRIWDRLNTTVNTLHQEEEAARRRTLVLMVLSLLSVITAVTYIVYLITQSLLRLRRAAERIAKGEAGESLQPESKDALGSLAVSISTIDQSNRALANAATAIGRGDFDAVITPRSEHDLLAQALIRMREALRQYRERMEHLVAVRTEELARSNEDLQRFAHVASHDLKEPLRKISTFSGILSENEKETLTEKGRIYLEKISDASRRMAGMIEGVLTYSTLSAAQHPNEPVDLNRVLSDVQSDLELAILQKGARIEFGTLPVVPGIALLLHQLFANLLNNALKFTKPGTAPHIHISARQEERGTDGQRKAFWHFEVRDNGIGFDQDQADRMFAVFTRLPTRDSYEGTGLGLALCKRIVQRHGGDIYARSRQGEGATFHVLLPARISG